MLQQALSFLLFDLYSSSKIQTKISLPLLTAKYFHSGENWRDLISALCLKLKTSYHSSVSQILANLSAAPVDIKSPSQLQSKQLTLTLCFNEAIIDQSSTRAIVTFPPLLPQARFLLFLEKAMQVTALFSENSFVSINC